jgi:hypothetical protein
VDQVRVLLAFRAHQPLCAARQLVASPLGRLVAVAEALGAPLGLALSNELAHLLRRDLPATFAELRRGYLQRRIRPLLTLAHETPAALLGPAELADELRLNRECVERWIGAPRPRYAGVMPAALLAGLDALEPLGFDFTFAPPPIGVAQPFRLGRRLVAIPQSPVELSPDDEVAIATLVEWIETTPHGSARAFVHDLGEIERVRRLWGELRDHPRVCLIGADEMLATQRPLPRSSEVEPAGERMPLVEAGVTGALEWLVEAFGFSRTPPVAAELLFELDYRLERLPPRAHVPMLLRRVKAASSVALDGDEAITRRPFLDGFRLCDALWVECRLADTRPSPPRGLPPEVLHGLERLPHLIVDPRLAYREVELERLSERGVETTAAKAELVEAGRALERARQAVDGVRTAYGELALHGFSGRVRWRTFVGNLREQLGAVCIALQHLERAALTQGTIARREVARL